MTLLVPSYTFAGLFHFLCASILVARWPYGLQTANVTMLACFLAALLIAYYASSVAAYFNCSVIVSCGAVLARLRYKHNKRLSHGFRN